MMEMMRDVDYSLWATEAAVATGLPVWVGISVERRETAACRLRPPRTGSSRTSSRR